MLHMWQPSLWGRGAAPTPVKSIDMNKWVSADLRGPPVKYDSTADKEDGTAKPGSPAAAHSLHGDESGRVLVGTVCNEIYEVDFDSSEPPMCYMQVGAAASRQNRPPPPSTAYSAHLMIRARLLHMSLHMPLHMPLLVTLLVTLLGTHATTHATTGYTTCYATWYTCHPL